MAQSPVYVIDRTRGEFLDIFPAYDSEAIRVEFSDRAVESLVRFDPLTSETKSKIQKTVIYPAKHFITHLTGIGELGR